MSSIFRRNIGTLDRVLRLALGVVLLAFAFTGPRTAWGYLGFIPIVTAIFSTCPLYSLLGISTCGVRGA